MSTLKYPLTKINVTQWFNDPCCRASYAKFGMDGHNGIDYQAGLGTRVYAAHSGFLNNGPYDKNGYGNFVWIDSASFETVYAHLNSFARGTGPVKTGDLIGYSGRTGNVTGPHLHFGYRPKPYNKTNGFLGYTDPQPLLTDTPEGPLMTQQDWRDYFKVWFPQMADAELDRVSKEKAASGLKPYDIMLETKRGLRGDFHQGFYGQPASDQYKSDKAGIPETQFAQETRSSVSTGADKRLEEVKQLVNKPL